MRLPKIAVTIGDPAGVGAEVVLKALAQPGLLEIAEWIVIGDDTAFRSVQPDYAAASCAQLCFRNSGALDPDFPIRFGELSAAAGAAAVEYVRIATELCLAGEVDAMVTAPLNKEAVVLSGMVFTGHTEYIAQLCGSTESRMLLASEKLATVHVSTHIPLEEACRFNQARIVRTIELGAEAMQIMLGRQPRIGVAGLNPHAGEHNLFGRQDSEVILPAVQQAEQMGFDCSGPHSPDAIFIRGVRGEFDLIVAMYHDQGHIPMKLIDFEETVNISLGIPIIRTSVDHGTAFDIAGHGRADCRNMRAAMRMAVRMAAGKLQRPTANVSATLGAS